MGYICLHCGEGLPEGEFCPCQSYAEDDDESPPPRPRKATLWPRQSGEERFYLEYEPGTGQCPPECMAHPQHVYILCYGQPVLVRDRDYLPGDPPENYPITHYVGWTGQKPPVKRIREHGARSAHHITAIRPGTVRDEEHAKRHERCPACGRSLWYFRVPR